MRGRQIGYRIVLILGLLLTRLPATEAQQEAEIPVVQSTSRGEAGRANYFQFKLPSYLVDARIAGNALASGGSGNDIRVLILAEQIFHRQGTERERRVGAILEKLVLRLEEEVKKLEARHIATPIYIGILDDPRLNASAIWQKGAIFVNRSTMELIESMPNAEGDDLLAGILGHELAHLFYRHERAVGVLAWDLAWDTNNKPYHRLQEIEADILGVKLACSAGFAASGLLTFMERLNFLRTHPSLTQRMDSLQKEIGKLSCPR